MANEILKIQKDHFSKDKEAHVTSDTKDLEKYLDKVEKHLTRQRQQSVVKNKRDKNYDDNTEKCQSNDSTDK